MSVGFGDRLIARVAERQSQIVLGIDPDPLALWPQAAGAQGNSVPERVADAVLRHCLALIDAVVEECVAVKLQLACFERLGAAGWAVLKRVTEHAHGHGLMVIADGKRGDIDVSARAYAQALLGQTDTPYGQLNGLGADLLTVNPLLGQDALEPFVQTARHADAGVLVLVRTSNRGACDLQDQRLADGMALWERIAAMASELGRDGIGNGGLSDVGAVMGATDPSHLQRARELMPAACFLLPGVGAQGGRVESLQAAFAPGRAYGLITASRSIASAHLSGGGDPAGAARAEAQRLRDAAWALG